MRKVAGYPFIKIVNKDLLVVRTDKGVKKVSRTDLERYINVERGSMSGMRSLGEIQGDWREIDAIASDVSEVFNTMKKKKLAEVV
jgi:hypothetical protein